MITSYAPYGPRGASSRVRLYDWFDYLGWDVDRHDYLGLPNNSVRNLVRRPLDIAREERALRRGHVQDRIALISREVSPISTGRLEARLLREAARGVFDFDDAIYLGGGRVRNLINQEKKARRAVEAADVVIAGNEVLASWASDYSDRVEIIPSCVNPDHYQQKEGYELPDTPRLIWIGSHSTERYLAGIAGALAEVNRLTGATVIAVGGPTDAPSALDQWSHFIRRVAWQPEQVSPLLSSADVALAPLDSDPYSRGKCAYKLLQYGAAALPMVGSPVGANDTALERLHGIKVSGSAEWVDGILEMLGESSSARARRGADARAGVERHYSYGSWSDRWRLAVTGTES